VIEVVAAPEDRDRDAIVAPLVAFDDAAVGPTERKPVAIVIRDDDGAIVCGLWGGAGYRWLLSNIWWFRPRCAGRVADAS
jgi:hypothetical protein